MSQPKASKILIEYEDGTKKSAEGKEAAAIWEHFNALETFYWVHGFRYQGPCLQPVEEKKEDNKGV